MKDGGEVILFPKARDEAIRPDVDVKKSTWQDCQHRVQLVLDDAAHQLICPACNQVLDPFDWIQKYIQNWAYQNSRYRQAVQQAQQAEKRVADLKRAETNTKARIRKGGLVITSKGARAAYEQMGALATILGRYLHGSDSEAVKEIMRWSGYKPEVAQVAIRELRQLCNLEVADEEIEMPRIA